MGKKIVLLSDGTGNAAASIWRTNVWRVFESIDLRGNDQVVFYDDGVGTSSFKPFALLGGAFGWGLKRNVIDLYKFVCRNYRSAEDDIFGFGFSRGAFTIRVVAGFILNQGLVTYHSESELDKQAKLAYRAYRTERFPSIGIEAGFRWLRDRLRTSLYNKSGNRAIAGIRFLGLWDTVAAYGLPVEEMTRGFSKWIWPLELPDRTLNERVQRACHALALDDERTTFHPVLRTEHGEVLPPPDAAGNRYIKDERISQVWFAGAHANVGGGYPDDSLAHVPLYWLMNEAGECGLKFKSSPDADPDALVHTKAARDKDGRLYDSRAGVGGYYRYGPRKLGDLCSARFSERPDDQVQIDSPKIHESVFKRIAAGAHFYAPIGLPSKYEVVTDNTGTEKGKILSSDHNPYETPNQARSRSQLQEKIWNIVWRRRIVYFATVLSSVFLILYPMIRVVPSSDEFETPLRPVSDFIRLVGAFLPGAFDVWVNNFARNPGQFLTVLTVMGLLMWWGLILADRIKDEMHSIWIVRDEKPDQLPNDWIYRLRSHPRYQEFIQGWKWYVGPGLFAITFIYFSVALVSHLAFNFVDAFGWICVNSVSTRSLGRGERSMAEFNIRAPCSGTGIILEHGGRYRLTISPSTPWRDGTLVTGTKGYYLSEVDWEKMPELFLALPLKRDFIRPWFRIIARIGKAGTDEDFVDPDPVGPIDQTLQEVIYPKRSGELFFYVNEAVIAVPWLYDCFYRNNQGTAQVLIERL